MPNDNQPPADPPVRSSDSLWRWAVAVTLTRPAWCSPVAVITRLGFWSAHSEAEAVGLAVREALEVNKEWQIGMVTPLKVEAP